MQAAGSSSGLDEAMLAQALGFLLSPKVQASDDVEKKKSFLKAKGMSDQLVTVAFERASQAASGQAASSQPQQQAPPAASATPYSSKFLQVMQAVQNGEDLPGVRQIDDKPRNDSFRATPSDGARPQKPWLKNRTVTGAKPYVKGLNGGPGVKYVKPAADPREADAAAAPPVGDKLQGLQESAPSAAPLGRDELAWQPVASSGWDSTNLADYCGEARPWAGASGGSTRCGC